MAVASKQSSALDYKKLAPKGGRTPGLQALPENRQVKRTAKTPYGKYLAIFGSVFVVLMVIVASYMRLTELTTQNARLKNQLAELESDENALSAKKEQVFNLAYVEDVAKNNLGMVKMDKSGVQYIELSNPEKTTIVNKGEGTPAFLSGLLKSFNAVLEYLR